MNELKVEEGREWAQIAELEVLRAENEKLKADVEKLKAEIVSLRQQICASQSNVMARDEYIQSLTTELVAALKDAENKQCRIDELILNII